MCSITQATPVPPRLQREVHVLRELGALREATAGSPGDVEASPKPPVWSLARLGVAFWESIGFLRLCQ